MSWGTCYSGSNNIHFDFPPIMADGRNYANWLPGSAVNERIRQDAGIKTNWQYRRYLTENADAIIRTNQIAACDECCSIPDTFNNSNTNEVISQQPSSQIQTPFLYKSCSDNSRPNYGYESSDLKNLYTSKLQLQERMVTPVVTQAQLLQQGFPRAK